MDKYRQWLTEQVQYWNQKCMDSAASYGYPGKIKFAELYMRENLDAYEQCLTVYNELRKPDAAQPATDEQRAEWVKRLGRKQE